MAGLAVADFGQIPMSQALAATLARASDGTRASGASEVSLEHLLFSLCDDPDAVAVLDASHVDIARLRSETVDYVMRTLKPGEGQGGALAVSPAVSRILEAAAAAARGGRRRDINGAIVLAAIVGDGKSAAAQMLQAQGLTFDEAIRALQAALTQPPPSRDGVSAPQPAEDVLARARERVQSRSTPSLREIMQDQPKPAPPPPPPAPSLEGSTPRAAPVPKAEPVLPPLPSAAAPAKAEAPADPSPAAREPATRQAERRVSEPAAAELEIAAPAPPPTPQVSVGAPPAAPAPTPALPPAPPVQPAAYAPPPDKSAALGGYVFPSAQPMARPPVPPRSAPQIAPPGRPVVFDLGQPAPAGQPPIPPPIPPMGGTARRAPTLPGGPHRSSPSPSASMRATPPPLARPAREAPVSRDGQAHAETGQLAENIPRTMRVGVSERVEVRIAKAHVKAIIDGLEGGGPAWRHDVTVTQAMSVRLRAPGGGFFIETASPETQWIESQFGLMAGDDFASWRFLVTPQARGWTSLQIIVSARTVGGDGLAAETALPDQVIEVKVRTNYKRVVGRWAGWIAAAVAGGAFAKFGEGAFETASQTAMHVVQRFLN